VGRDGTPSGQACTASSGQTSKKEQYTMFNKVILIGRLGKNAETKTAQNKKDYAVLNLATSESWKNEQGEYETRTEWHDRRDCQGPTGQVHHRRNSRFKHPASLEGRSR
jgi:hypothetical protein